MILRNVIALRGNFPVWRKQILEFFKMEGGAKNVLQGTASQGGGAEMT